MTVVVAKAPGVMTCLSIFAFLGYWVAFQLGYLEALPQAREARAQLVQQGEAKIRRIRETCLLIVGGSNTRMGISARLLSSRACPAGNLGVSSEMGGFSVYREWMATNAVRTDTALYSSLDIWSDNPNHATQNTSSSFHWLPSVTLYAQVRSLFRAVGVNPSSPDEFDVFGDQTAYACDGFTGAVTLSRSGFVSSHDESVAEIAQRVRTIKAVTGAKLVLVLIPWLYVRKTDSAFFQTAIDERARRLVSMGVGVLRTPRVSSTGRLFCGDGYHLNPTGRDSLSRLIRKRLDEIRAAATASVRSIGGRSVPQIDFPSVGHAVGLPPARHRASTLGVG
ncbi:MAG: hypothetical protein KJT01_14835 [Gemmatimonadetes bacterium]|nr:hypothetical protein [Gemmatimonadota bacterium]